MNMKTLEVLKTLKLLLLDGKDDLVNDHEQDLDQQLLLELRDPVGAMAVHRQLVEVFSSCIVHLECWSLRKHINDQYTIIYGLQQEFQTRVVCSPSTLTNFISPAAGGPCKTSLTRHRPFSVHLGRNLLSIITDS